MSEERLSKGEKKVIAAYNGNLRETAILCEMSYGHVRNIVAKPYIVKHIDARNKELSERECAPLIAGREERQAFWTSVMMGKPQVVGVEQKVDDEGEPMVDDDGNPVMEEIKEVPKMSARLKASEHLGRSNADFLDRHDDEAPEQEIEGFEFEEVTK